MDREWLEGGWLEFLGESQADKVIEFVEELRAMLESIIDTIADVFDYIGSLF